MSKSLEDIKLIPTASPKPFLTSLESSSTKLFLSVYFTSSSETLRVFTEIKELFC